MARGSLGTVREGMKRAKDNLSAKEYRDIDALHRKQLIEVKTTEMAASDLDKYHKVCKATSSRLFSVEEFLAAPLREWHMLQSLLKWKGTCLLTRTS